MNIFSVLLALGVGVFTVSQAVALSSVFDYYFYLLPFGMALTGVFLAAATGGLPLVALMSSVVLRAFPVFGGLAMLLCVVLYLVASSLGSSLFFLLVITFQLIANVFLASALVREGEVASSAAGAAIGLTLGQISIAYLNVDPLTMTLIAAFFVSAIYLARFLVHGQLAAYILIVGCASFAVFQGKQQHVMPVSLGWELDQGKTEPANRVDKPSAKPVWGPAGATSLYELDEEDRAGWLYTNASSPALVLMDEPTSYDDGWWAQKAPLTMAIHDAVRPGSLIEIGMAPGDMVWRALGLGGRNLFGVYGSSGWTRLSVPGLESANRSVVLLQTPALSEERKLGFPVEMVVVSSGHAGKEGWLSSSAGEQTFLNQESILSYWQALDKNGTLVLLSRQESVFLRQLFGVWSALSHSGMSDAEFLDRVWAIVPDAGTGASPYRYALVLTKKARDEKFAQAIRGQVLKLPVRYLFGYGLPPSEPYHVLYQNDLNKAQAIFSQAASRMYGKYVTLEASDSRKSIPYQFVEDVLPKYKNMLVVSVGILLATILFPVQKFRRVEAIQSSAGPSAAVWLVTAGATGALMVVSLAFLIVYPSGVGQELRLLYLVVLGLFAAWASFYPKLVSRPVLPVVFASVLVLMSYVAAEYMQIMGDASTVYVAVAGGVFALLIMTLPVTRSYLINDSGELAGWWWFATAAGALAALFWSMRLYAVFGDGLLLISGLLLICIAGVFWWHGHPPIELRERGVAGGGDPV